MKKSNIILFIAALMMGMTAVAQDLSSQRGESQDVGVLLGEKLHHNGLVVNPTPQEMVRYDTTLDISRGIALKGNAGEYAQELDFLSASRQGVALRIDKDVNLPARYGVKLVPGAYRMDITHKGIVLKNYKDISLMQLLDNLVHEFNHAINSINQELRIIDDKLYVRTGLTFIIYDKHNLKGIGKEDNSILEEIINTKQTEMIINIINTFNSYEIHNSTVVNTLYSIKNSISNSYQSNAYLLQLMVCKSLVYNKTFFSTLENLRFKGNIDDIEIWFDSITGREGSYKKLIELLKLTMEYQVQLTKKKVFKSFIINKIKKLNQEAMIIVNLFDQNCNYR